MGVKTRTLAEVRCDACGAGETFEGNDYTTKLDTRGYGRVRLSVDAHDPTLQGAMSFSVEDIVLCRECIGKVKRLLGIRDDPMPKI